jgi:hypothetical protein
LRVVGKPEVKRVTLEGTVQISDNKVVNRNVSARLTIETRIRVRNDGNTNAKFMFHAVTDSLSGVPEMRNIMLGRDLSKKANLMLSMSNEHYETKDILPGKEDTFEGITKVDNIKDDQFTIHYWLVYNNEAGNVYNTYYWARFATKKTVIYPQADSYTIQQALLNSVEFVDDNQSYECYNRLDSGRLRSFYLDDLHKVSPSSSEHYSLSIPWKK